MLKKILDSYYHKILIICITLLISLNFLIKDDIIRSAITSFFFSIVFLVAAFSVKTINNRLLYFALGIIVIQLISNHITDNTFIYIFATVIIFIFFLVIVYKLIFQVAKSKVVNSVVILESINAYLLIGLSNSILAALINSVSETAYSFSNPVNESFSDFIYYGFITQTTIGYGDISPISDLAKLHSITFGVVGQLYLTIIIAILVGKFISQKNEKA